MLTLINGLDKAARKYCQNLKLNIDFKYLALDIEKPVGEARNDLIEMATGEYICFLDDDTEVGEDYFKKAEKIISFEGDAEVFGGPDQTKKHSSDFQLILGEVMQTYLAMGPTLKRHKSSNEKIDSADELSLILCNLWIKKSALIEGASFPKGYKRNEENILLAKLKRMNKKILYFSDLIVYHERKNTFKKLMKATYYSGSCRAFGFFDEVDTFRWYFLIPQIGLLTFFTTLLLSPKLFTIIFSIYFLVVLAFSLIVSIKALRIKKFYLAIAFYFIYNFTYPIGMIDGYARALGRTKK